MDKCYRLLAAKYVRRQAKQLAAQLEGVRAAEDIEFVHRARVASRRLRAALRLARDCFPRKTFNRWRKHIRRLTRGLGDARDKDVQIEFLYGVLHELNQQACYPGIARLLVQLEQERERLQPKVLQAVEGLEAAGILEEMRDVGTLIVSDAKARNLSVQSPFVYRETEKHVLRRLEKLLALEDSLANPEDQRRHHAMRIAAKRLRYTLEIVKPVHKAQLDEAIEAVKKVQTLLGEVHDCDVWLEQLRAFAEAQRRQIMAHFGNCGPFSRLEPGIEYLQENRARRRREAFQEVAEYWKQLKAHGCFEQLVQIIQARGELPAAKDAPLQPSPAAARSVSIGHVSPAPVACAAPAGACAPKANGESAALQREA